MGFLLREHQMDTYSLEAFPTQSRDLMEHSHQNGDLGLRIVTSVTGSSIICVIQQENADSFLALLPSRLLAADDKFMIEAYMAVPFIRIMKATSVSVVPAFGDFEFYYTDFLIKRGKELCPQGNFDVQKLQQRFDVLVELNKKKLAAQPEILVFEDDWENEAEPITLDEDSSLLLSLPVTGQKYKH